ncbi:DNA-binding CsgD family transcriptional regulator [Actinoplanes octamycinicus]|uniref:DNA-binding CsgD family transcriptional regulator n=1 Tax=Actinoplanes octamycinicus TaxID=135948 RepID=A0A7W7H3Q8_9ACTN|nr:LuxR C-terminal-related transcriptional regulator [Actinoplanes octamycinicus]MBB4743443.1 DNA-binding CsgD family transcriptional regulator [Actinoplanes octamycinicus]GIE63440.1 hypothetical protein Aoc01nite_88420 [Actinoplanes octamycinicus]
MSLLPSGRRSRRALTAPVAGVVALLLLSGARRRGGGHAAMLPLRHNEHTAPASVLIHPSGLLDAMLAFYDVLWERGYPVAPGAAGEELDEVDRRLLSLLLSGLTDQAVAGRLGLSLRTVQRRIHQLMTKAGVHTRLQLGWHAATRGWA